MNENRKLRVILDKMLEDFGPRHWWPARNTFEVIVGAILTQSVSWTNVSKAIENLRLAGLLEAKALYDAPIETIEKPIVPTLYWRMKAKKLKAFVNHLYRNYGGNLEAMFDKSISELRGELLGIYGIGPETADSIILYAAGKPIFVVDAYTRRIFSRLGIFPQDISYSEMQAYFMLHLPPDTEFYNEYHALIVGVGNKYCSNKKPDCINCPLLKFCKFADKND